jgi:ATP-dependent Clp protease ATP-binding subunit ClpA
VTSDQPYAEVQARVRAEIESHFKLALNRPEILNRIGENIIVFDFIRPEVAKRIFENMVQNVLEDAASSGYEVSLTGPVRDLLRERCIADLSNGGRGVRNKIEAHLINPLARALFEEETKGPFIIRRVELDPLPSLHLEPVS